jgi:predicted acylesterase/phospholipase RssA
VPARRFADLRLPLAVTATDLDTGRRVVLGDGGEDAPLVEALVASCALPIYYAPVRVNGLRLADGGLRAALPLWAVRDETTDVLAVDVGPRFDETPGRDRSGPALVQLADAPLGIAMASVSEAQVAAWRARPGAPRLVLIRPPVPQHATFATEVADQCITAGRAATEAALAGTTWPGGAQ